MEIEKPERRRRVHNKAFKDELVRVCSEAGRSVAGVALAIGVNANLVRRWMAERGIAAPSMRTSAIADPSTVRVPEFVAVTVTPAQSMAVIRIEVQRAHGVVKIDWPVESAGACASWLRNWLK